MLIGNLMLTTCVMWIKSKLIMLPLPEVETVALIPVQFAGH
ncbi:hypothetical protein SAMN05661099_2834 [Daejeonella lutea]|uniref:Uncharacterized protein n=1 Tax=Daejeonella lutea TaxID=572036 RepID=A0A1T5EA44_9SPHI|nr:hypothetical protein SAMN05661099_2834 [Daejeonella lutea]